MKMMPQQPPPMVPPGSPTPPGAGPQGLGGNPNLRPRDAFEVFREGFAMAGKWFPAFVLTIAIVALIRSTASYVLDTSYNLSIILEENPNASLIILFQKYVEYLIIRMALDLVTDIIIKFIFSASMATFVFAALHYQKTGQKIPLSEAFKEAKPYLVTFILLDVIVEILIGFGLVLIIPGLLFAVWWSVVLPTMFDEKKGISDAMARSKDLVQGFKWHVLGYIILINLAGAFVTLIISEAILINATTTVTDSSGLLSANVITDRPLYFAGTFAGAFLGFFFNGVDYMARAVLYMDLLARQHQRQMMMAMYYQMYYQQHPPPHPGMVPPAGVPLLGPQQYLPSQGSPQSLPPSAYQYPPPTSTATAVPTCSSCGSLAESGARFCPNCGTPLGEQQQPTSSPSAQAGLTCKACGHVNSNDALFCISCGTRLQ